ncbi:MAG TPA: hypothetical protein VKZ53_04735 [Candidatus Angelobacter sp.]|nr:hypothetical protein [Candidatus Angelobacter sp.]
MRPQQGEYGGVMNRLQLRDDSFGILLGNGMPHYNQVKWFRA